MMENNSSIFECGFIAENKVSTDKLEALLAKILPKSKPQIIATKTIKGANNLFLFIYSYFNYFY